VGESAQGLIRGSEAVGLVFLSSGTRRCVDALLLNSDSSRYVEVCSFPGLVRRQTQRQCFGWLYSLWNPVRSVVIELRQLGQKWL